MGRYIVMILLLFSINGFSQKTESANYLIILVGGDSISVEKLNRINKELILVRNLNNENIYYSLNEIKSVYLNQNGEWHQIYPQPEVRIDSSKNIEEQFKGLSKSDKFNVTHFLIQSIGGYLISGLLGIGAETLVYKTMGSGEGLGSGFTFFCVYIFSTPFTVYYIGETLTNHEKYETSFADTFFSGGFLAAATIGVLAPVGASLGYQSGKTEKVSSDKNPDMGKEK